MTTATFHRDASTHHHRRQEIPASGHELAPSWLIFILGAALTHSGVVFGFNVSAADLFLLGALTIGLLSASFRIPVQPLMGFVVVATVTSLVGLAATPAMFEISGNPVAVIGELLKLTVSFLYLVLGFNLVGHDQLWTLLRGFYSAAVGLALLGLMSMFIGFIASSETLFYGGVRYRGLMIDPNYFSVLQVCAAIALRHDPRPGTRWRYLGIGLLAFSILLSGSKTGIFVLALWAIYELIASQIAASRGSALGALKLLGVGACASVLFLQHDGILKAWTAQVERWAGPLPVLERLVPLLTFSGDAIGGDGSGRDDAWSSAISIIHASPLWGVGLGTYVEVSTATNGVDVLAHNTFLQLAAEWGLPLALAFFLWVVLSLLRLRPGTPAVAVARGVVIVMLLGSMGISLNNARLFWLGLGLCLALATTRQPLGQRP